MTIASIGDMATLLLLLLGLQAVLGSFATGRGSHLPTNTCSCLVARYINMGQLLTTLFVRLATRLCKRATYNIRR